MTAAPVWSALGWTMLHFLWVGTALGVLAAVGRRLLRHAGPDVQYAYALACLTLLAAAPAVIAARLLATPPLRADVVSVPSSLPTAVSDVSTAPTPRGVSRRADRAAPPPPLPIFDVAEPGPPGSGARALETLAHGLPYVWLVGAPVTFASLAFGLAGAERLRRWSVLVVDPAVTALVRRSADALGVAGRVALATCDRVAAPVLVGVVRPMILLPAAALTGWTPEQLELALLHELAHVRRRDNLVILLQRLVESALFFHPAVWVVSGWAHRWREHACDAAVVRRTGRPLAYAEALLALADAGRPRRSAAVPMAEGDLVVRVRRLLSQEDRTMTLPRTTLALAAGLLLAPLLLLAAPPPRENADGPPRERVPDEALRRVAAEAFESLNGPKGGARSADLVSVAKAQAAIGDRTAARETLRLAARRAAAAGQRVVRRENTISYGPSSASQLWDVARCQAELGDAPGALATLRLALKAEDPEESAGGRMETYARIAKDFTALGARDEARAVARRAAREFEAREGRDDAPVLPHLAAVHTAAGDPDGAFAVLDRIDAGPGNDFYKRSVVGHSLGAMAGAVDTSDRPSARALLDRILRRLDRTNTNSNTLNSVAVALARVGDFEGALKVARSAGKAPNGVDDDPDDTARPYVLRQVALERHRAGDAAEARKILREAYESTRELNGPARKDGRLLELAATMAHVGDFARAVRCADDTSSPGRRCEVLAEVASAQRKAGDRDGARATLLRALEGPKPPEGGRDVEWAVGLAKVRALQGDFEAAHKTADAIPSPVLRRITLGDVARIQAASGDARGALDWARALAEPAFDPSLMKAVIDGIAESARAAAGRHDRLTVVHKDRLRSVAKGVVLDVEVELDGPEASAVPGVATAAFERDDASGGESAGAPLTKVAGRPNAHRAAFRVRSPASSGKYVFSAKVVLNGSGRVVCSESVEVEVASE